MPALGSIHAIARAVCTFQDRPCRSGDCSPCLERARRAVRAMRDAGAIRLAQYCHSYQLAREAHAGQVDKAGYAYTSHLARVQDRFDGLTDREQRDEWTSRRTEDLFSACWLHDVVEDTPVTLDDLLLRGFSDETIEVVRLLTKAPVDARTYDERITALIASGNLGAILVKLADVEDNGDPARLALLPEDQRGIGERYQRARARLHEAATALGWRDPREQAESAA